MSQLKMWSRSKQRILNRGIANGRKHLKKCSVSLTIRKIQVQRTQRFHLTHVRMAITKTQVTTHPVVDVDEGE